MEGIIFDIQKFALHDGPGIRTAVFLKGCPLKCVWCCNPESQSAEPQCAIINERCNHCLKCTIVCKAEAFVDENNHLSINQKLCNACGTCVAKCSENALKMYGYSASTDTIMNEVLKDKAYYDNSGGGITLTGGEPMEQPEFLFELLTKAKQAGLHTCVETSGYSKKENYQRILPLVDLFFVDYKLTDSLMHKQYTGKGNEKILSNLKFLYDNRAQLIIRCPIIPGINDTPEHFKGIAALSTHFPNISGVEIMPYHSYGSHKYAQIGRTAYPVIPDSENKEIASDWLSSILKLGGHKTFISK